MFHSISKAFRAVDDFLTLCEEYTEERVWNGKFINDIKFLSVTTTENIKDSSKNAKSRILSSSAYALIVALLQKFVGLLMSNKIVADTIILSLEGFRLCIKYFAHYLIILILGLGSVYLLLMTFKYAPLVFVTLFLPILYANHLFLSGFFILVEKKEQGTHISLGEVINHINQTLPANTFIFLLQNALALTVGVFYLGCAFFLSTLFASVSIDWSTSFFYWLIMVIIGLVIGLLLYITEVILSFSYTFALQEKKTAFAALQKSEQLIQHNMRYSLLFYFLLTTFACIFITSITSKIYEGGFLIGVLFMSHAFLWLGFLLRKNYFKKDLPDQPTAFIQKTFQFTKFALAVGLIAYFSSVALVIRLQPEILQSLAELRPTMAESYEYATYTNSEAGYEIRYPKLWTVYKWNSAETTISTNDTGTDVGSVRIRIAIKSLDESNYTAIYDADPGIIEYDAETGNVKTKEANVTLDNDIVAPKYKALEAGAEQPEFQTHYLIGRDSTVYDISLMTHSKKIETAYMETFELMVNSFKILP